jgi:predicted TIM-barrel enzyme
MARIPRQTLLNLFRTKIAAGRPLIGGGAGTGLSAWQGAARWPG